MLKSAMMPGMEVTLHETNLCLIKRHKNRGRYELYIHAEGLREFIKKHSLEIVDEDLTTKVRLKKKMLFSSLKYGKMLARILDQMSTKLAQGVTDGSVLQIFLDSLYLIIQERAQSLDPTSFKSEAEFRGACYSKVLPIS